MLRKEVRLYLYKYFYVSYVRTINYSVLRTASVSRATQPAVTYVHEPSTCRGWLVWKPPAVVVHGNVARAATLHPLVNSGVLRAALRSFEVTGR